MKAKFPSFDYEKRLWEQGCSLVVGVDEVGRGAFAGPVVAGAAAVQVSRIEYLVSGIQDTKYNIQDTILRLGIHDSKLVPAKRRQALVPHINAYFHSAVGEASVGEINRYGIVAATQRAMRRAIRGLVSRSAYLVSSIPEQSFLLLDAFHLPHCSGFPRSRQQAIIKGDQLSISIAAASIVAKVYRDAQMEQLAHKHPQYGWEENKGYGTRLHRMMLAKHGITPLHRSLFCQKSLV